MTPSHKEKKTRIKWTAEEIKPLAEAIARRRLEDPIPSLTLIFHEEQATYVPANRRRNVPTITGIPELVAAIKTEISQQIRAQSVEIPIAIPIPAEIDSAKLASELTDAELIHEGANRLAKLMARFNLSLNRENLAALGTAPATRIITHEHRSDKQEGRITVALIGPHPNQYKIIEEKCASLGLRLVFVDKDKKLNVPTSADYIVIQSRFVSHSAIAVIKGMGRLAGRIVELEPNEGITGVCKALADIKARAGMAGR